jgi:hypothetical protein
MSGTPIPATHRLHGQLNQQNLKFWLVLGSVSSPISARWPTYSSSGSAGWALDVDIGAGVFQQTDSLKVDSW